MSLLNHSVTLFYPVYNEVDSIRLITDKALQVMQQAASDFEILIIDDGSTDGSGQIADELAAVDPHIRAIHHNGNQGYGQALRTGFTRATKDVVIYTDADEPVDLWRIPEALRYLENYEMVIGYRLKRSEGLRRLLFSKVYNLLVRILFGVHVHDINFSFKLIRRTELQKLHLAAGSAFIDGELLAEVARHHLRIFEMPIQYLPRKFGESKFNNLRAATFTLEEIWMYWQRRRIEAQAKRMPVESTIELDLPPN